MIQSLTFSRLPSTTPAPIHRPDPCAPSASMDSVTWSEELTEAEPERQNPLAFLTNLGSAPSQEAMSQALEGDGSGIFRNGEGQSVDFTVSPGESTAGYDRFSLQLGHDQLDVSIAEGLDWERALGRIADFYSQQDENLRGVLNTVTVEAGRNPDDARWAEQRDMPGFRSAAVGAGGSITFFNGLRNLNEDVFAHEFGHNLGGNVRYQQDLASQAAGRLAADRQQDQVSGDAVSPNVPRGYSQVAEADQRGVSRYGDRAIGEDFAEFYEAYRNAQQQGPEGLARLQSLYPERFDFFQTQVLSLDFSTQG